MGSPRSAPECVNGLVIAAPDAYTGTLDNGPNAHSARVVGLTGAERKL